MGTYSVIVDGDDREQWMLARGEGVTASEVRQIATGGRATWRRILEQKLNGNKFRGNRHTRRGHEREPLLIEFAATLEPCQANHALLGAATNPLHRATPDGISDDFGVEVKSHAHGWTRTDIPAEHYDQMQWGMHVTGFNRWLYIWEVLDEDGYAPLEDPAHVWVARDEKRIAELTKAADAFIAWREAGAPALADVPDDVDDALAEWAAAKAEKAAAAKREKAAEGRIREFIKTIPHAETEGAKRAGTQCGFNLVVSKTVDIDMDRLEAEDPELAKSLEDSRVRLKWLEDSIRKDFPREVIKTTLRASKGA